MILHPTSLVEVIPSLCSSPAPPPPAWNSPPPLPPRRCERFNRCRHLLIRVATVKVLSETSIKALGEEERMVKGLIWATTEDLVRNRSRVLSLYRQVLRSLNSPQLPMSWAARMAKKAEVRAMFMLGSEERSIHNIKDLIDAAEYSLSLLRKGEIPKYIQ